MSRWDYLKKFNEIDGLFGLVQRRGGLCFKVVGKGTGKNK